MRKDCFFRAPGTGKAGVLFGQIDNGGFNAAQIKDVNAEPGETKEKARNSGEQRTEKQKEIPESRNAVKLFCNGSENLHAIAQQFHVTADAIRAANPETNLDQLYHGLSFIVPARKMTISTELGTVRPEQCVPVRYDPDELKTYSEGQEVKVE